MADYYVAPKSSFDATADAIREKTGSSADIEWTQDGFADAIVDINSGLSIDDIASGLEPSGAIILKNSTTTIGAMAFAGKPITSISGSGVTSIGTNAFDGATQLASINLPNLTTKTGDSHFRKTAIIEFINEKSFVPTSNMFQDCPNLKRIVLMGEGNMSGNYWIQKCPNLEEIICPNATNFSPSGFGFQDDAKLNLIDAGKTSQLYGSSLPAAAPLSIIIIRKDNGLVSMQTPEGFNSTAFAQGGTGGTIYIPEVLYNHLEDGSNLDYTIQTNWATFLAKGTVTWAKIEGSPYESTEWWKSS